MFILVTTSTLAFVYKVRRRSCSEAPSPWCYDDWECKDVQSGDGKFPSQLTQKSAKTCSPDSDVTLCPNAWGLGNP